MSDLSVRHGYRSRCFRSLTAAAAMLLGTGYAMAQEAAPAAAPEAVVLVEEDSVNNGRISLSGGVDFTTQYIFRGILQEDSGFIAQPWAEVGFNLYSGEGAINSIDLVFNTWNSLHSKQTGSTEGGAEIWYESDFTMGINVGLFEKWSTGVAYVAYVSPNDAFNTVQEIDLSLGYDDSAHWEGNSFNFGGFAPSATLAFEFDGQADGGAHKGIYLELGLSPSFTVIQSETYPVTLTVPLTVGLSPDSDYYEFGTDDDAFGYFDFGAVFSVPLAFMPRDFGAWEAYAGVHFLFLGDTTEEFNDGDSEDWEVLGTFGFSFAY